MAKRINYKVDTTFKTLLPTQTEIKTKDGKAFTVRLETTRGNPEDPLSREGMIAKFKDCANYIKNPIPAAKLEELIAKLLELEKVKDMKEITDFLS